MDRQLAVEKSKKIGISTVQIVREEYELLILSHIFETPFGKYLVFKGGTALRLAYNSPRFSDDLDFDVVGLVNESNFVSWCKRIEKENPSFKLSESLEKKNTLFALFKITDPALDVVISIKIEISTRKEHLKKDTDYKLINLRSEVTPITVLAQVATKERIWEDKQKIKPKRIRDIFDLWFLGTLLNKEYMINFGEYKPSIVRSELHRLLGMGSRELLRKWL